MSLFAKSMDGAAVKVTCTLDDQKTVSLARNVVPVFLRQIGMTANQATTDCMITSNTRVYITLLTSALGLTICERPQLAFVW